MLLSYNYNLCRYVCRGVCGGVWVWVCVCVCIHAWDKYTRS